MTQGRCDLLFLAGESFSSPSSFLLAAASSSSCEASRNTSTTRWLPGDQAKSSTSCGRSVRRWASPPRRFKRYNWVLLSLRSEIKASDLPSGDQRGRSDDCPSAVSASGSPPAEGTIQTRVSVLSSFKDEVVTVKAMNWPSGENCASCTSRKSKKSSIPGGRGAAGCWAMAKEPPSGRAMRTSRRHGQSLTRPSCVGLSFMGVAPGYECGRYY